jgi:RNA polymerase sigma-70 factor, ECF subfamily
MTLSTRTLDYAALPEADLVAYARAGRREAFAALMTRGNQRLFRIARAVVRDESEAEDVLQEAYVRAFAKLSDFRGEASIYTWLTRIVLNEAHGRLRRRRHTVELSAVESAQAGEGRILVFPSALTSDDPERDAALAETRRLLERAVDALPEAFRLVFILREVEELTVGETAEHLGLPEATVKTRLHRARRRLRHALEAQLADVMTGAYPFLGERCAGISERVLARM